MNYSEFSAKYTTLVRSVLREQLTRIEQPTLHAASAHLIGRGKLYRPLLALATSYALNKDEPDELVQFVTPLELIHTFTLIHDDLPCMDDADLRRGLPSVHLRYGEAMAVLAGDALLNLALTELAEAGELDPDSRVLLIRCATRATQSVVEGQVMDIEGEGRQIELEALQALHARKTGALIGACCETGAILAGADADLTSRLKGIGEMLGTAFQIRDDLLELTSTQAQAGKSLSADSVKEKATYPRIVGHDASQAELARLTDVLKREIDSLALASPQLLHKFVDAAIERES